MISWLWFTLLMAGAYLLGSVPASYLAARYCRGLDLRRYGTGQVGGGNLWRMTSWQLGLPVGAFDSFKGLVMVWAAHAVGLSIAQQILVGSGAIIGHNWPIFLRFNGGRGVGTMMGVIFILPIINDMAPWTTIVFFAILVAGSVALRSSPLPVLVAAVALPLVSLGIQESLPTTLAYLIILAIIVSRRLAAPSSAETASVSKVRLIINRLLFDRDINDRKLWMYRKPIAPKVQKEG